MPDPAPPYTTVIIRSTDLDPSGFLTFNTSFPKSRCVECVRIVIDMRYQNISAELGNNKVMIYWVLAGTPGVTTITMPDGFYNIGTSGTTSPTQAAGNGLPFWTNLAAALNAAAPFNSSNISWVAGIDESTMKAKLTATNNGTDTFSFYIDSNSPLMGVNTNYYRPNSNFIAAAISGGSGTWRSPGFPTSTTIFGLELLCSELQACEFTSSRENLRPVLKYIPTENTFGTTIVDSIPSSFWLDQSKQISQIGFQLYTSTGGASPTTITWSAEIRFYQ